MKRFSRWCIAYNCAPIEILNLRKNCPRFYTTTTQVYDAITEVLCARQKCKCKCKCNAKRNQSLRLCQFSPFYLKLRASVRKMCYTITPLFSITKIDYEEIIQLKPKLLSISKERGKYEGLEMGKKSSEFVWEKWLAWYTQELLFNSLRLN